MSENKYIIDKDSLTGIADAVRNKLGTGEATTDPQTGDIVYPEDKGYYLKQGKVAGLIYPGDKGSQASVMNVSNETVQELCGGIVPTYIKFTVLALASSYQAGYYTACGLSYNGTKFYVHSTGGYSGYLQNIVGSTKTISYNSTVGCQIIGISGTYGSSYQTFSYFELPGSIKIEFLDENEDNILTSIEGPISAGLSSYNYTMEIPTSLVPTKIPFSIDDIRNKIINLPSSGGAPKIAVLNNFYAGGIRASNFTNLKDYGGFSNIYLIIGLYNNSYLGYLDMVNHPDKVGTYNGYDTYRFYQRYGGAEQTIIDVQHDTSNGNDRLYAMRDYYGVDLSPCFIVYKEA